MVEFIGEIASDSSMEAVRLVIHSVASEGFYVDVREGKRCCSPVNPGVDDSCVACSGLVGVVAKAQGNGRLHAARRCCAETWFERMSGKRKGCGYCHGERDQGGVAKVLSDDGVLQGA